MDLGLKGKVAVITGGSAGIGLSIAKGLSREGVHVALCARNEERLLKVTENLRNKYKIRAIGIKADITNPADINNLRDKIEKEFSGVDILINNAGAGSEEKIMDAPDRKWQYYWDLHVMAVVRLSRAIVPLMDKKNGGVILNTASVCAKQPLDYEPIYNVTKAALVMLSKCLANELISHNIRVNCVSPGYTLTSDWKKTAASLGKKEGITWEEYISRVAKQNVPICRFASPEEIANLFVFLCSPKASYCVGSTYYIDGGCVKVII